MNDTTLVFIEACTECGRVQRVYSKRSARRQAPVRCAECAIAFKPRLSHEPVAAKRRNRG